VAVRQCLFMTNNKIMTSNHTPVIMNIVYVRWN